MLEFFDRILKGLKRDNTSRIFSAFIISLVVDAITISECYHGNIGTSYFFLIYSSIFLVFGLLFYVGYKFPVFFDKKINYILYFFPVLFGILQNEFHGFFDVIKSIFRQIISLGRILFFCSLFFIIFGKIFSQSSEAIINYDWLSLKMFVSFYHMIISAPVQLIELLGISFIFAFFERIIKILIFILRTSFTHVIKIIIVASIFYTLLFIDNQFYPIGITLIITTGLLLIEMRFVFRTKKNRDTTNSDWFTFIGNSAVSAGKNQYISGDGRLFLQFWNILSNFVVRISEMKDIKELIPYLYDDPIDTLNEDKIQSEAVAKKIFKRIFGSKKLPNNYAVVAGIQGSQGSGKTSIVNLLKHEYLDMVPNDIVYMDFNVWQHSGDLTTSFLREFSVFLEINKIATQSISQKFEQYIEKVSDMHPVVRSFSRLIERKYTTQEIFSDISQLIIDSKKRIVIFIDDVDRLGDWNQWNQLFSILRATANFSNVFYVVCFSKKELQKIFPAHFKDALTQDVDVYIEKIFNLKYNLDFGVKAIMDGNENSLETQVYMHTELMSQIDVITDTVFKDKLFESQAVGIYNCTIKKWEDDLRLLTDKTHKQSLDNLKNKNIQQAFKEYMGENFIEELRERLYTDCQITGITKHEEQIPSEFLFQPDRTPRLIKIIINDILELIYSDLKLNTIKDMFTQKIVKLGEVTIPFSAIRGLPEQIIDGSFTYESGNWNISGGWRDKGLLREIGKILKKNHIVNI